MSEDRLTFYFHSQKEKNEIRKHINKLESIYKKEGIVINETNGGRDKETGQYSIGLWHEHENEDKAILLSLKYINTLPSENIPYAELELDTTGDKFYYILQNNKVLSIGDKEELNSFLAKGKDSPERNFYSRHTKGNILLIKIGFSRKKDIQKLSDTIESFIKESHSSNAINNVVEVMNSMMKIHSKEEPDFPSSIYRIPYQENKKISGNSEYLKYLCFSSIEGKNLFIGFEFPKEIDLIPLGKNSCTFGGLYENAKDDDISQSLVALVDCFYIANGHKNVKAKYNSCNLNRNGNKNISEFCGLDEEFFQFGPSNPIPSQIWPS